VHRPRIQPHDSLEVRAQSARVTEVRAACKARDGLGVGGRMLEEDGNAHARKEEAACKSQVERARAAAEGSEFPWMARELPALWPVAWTPLCVA
jgi:hypothetical protein